jgi:hypothetical protein
MRGIGVMTNGYSDGRIHTVFTLQVQHATTSRNSFFCLNCDCTGT